MVLFALFLACRQRQPCARFARAGKGDQNMVKVRILVTFWVVSRCDPFRVAGAPEGCRFAAAGPNNVRQVLGQFRRGSCFSAKKN